MDTLYEEVGKLFNTLYLVGRVCLIVALILLAGAATRWFNAHTGNKQGNLR